MDGRCLYRSIAHEFLGDENRWSAIREQMMKAGEERGYLSQMEVEELKSDTFSWGGDKEMAILTDVLEIMIILITSHEETRDVNTLVYGTNYRRQVYMVRQKDHFMPFTDAQVGLSIAERFK